MHAPIIAAMAALIAPATTASPAISIHGEPTSPKVKVANLILARVQNGEPRSLVDLVTPDAMLSETFSAPAKLTPAALARVLSACLAADEERLQSGDDWIAVTMLCPVDPGGRRYSHLVRFDFRGDKVSEVSFSAMVAPPAPPPQRR